MSISDKICLLFLLEFGNTRQDVAGKFSDTRGECENRSDSASATGGKQELQGVISQFVAKAGERGAEAAGNL